MRNWLPILVILIESGTIAASRTSAEEFTPEIMKRCFQKQKTSNTKIDNRTYQRTMDAVSDPELALNIIQGLSASPQGIAFIRSCLACDKGDAKACASITSPANK